MGPLEQANPPSKDAKPIKEEVKDGLAIKDPLKVPVFVPTVPNVPPKVNEGVQHKGGKNFEFVIPNKALFKDNFWT